MNFERFTKTNKKISTALMQAALMATSFSASAASAAYYSGRRGAYSSAKNKSYLVDSSFGGGSRNLFKQSKVAVNQPKPVEINHADDLAILRSPVKELLVVDHNIKGYQQFSALLKPGVELLEIPQEVDGLAFLLNKLSQYQGLQAIHLFSHANAGELLLGSTIVDTETLKSNTEFAKVINQSVKAGGDFLLYGCELGKGEVGDEFLEIIKRNTHADVAASNNLTGNKAFNADWDLEIQKGDIEAKPLANSIAMKDFTEVLQTVTFQEGSWNVVDHGSNNGRFTPYGANDPTAANKDALVKQTVNGVERTLKVDGEYNSIGVSPGYGISFGFSEKSITLSFTDGSTFKPSSIEIYAYHGDQTTITTNNGGSISFNITNYFNGPIDLTSLPTGATSLTITNNSWDSFLQNSFNNGLIGAIRKITFEDIGAAAPPAITTSATPLSDFSTCAGTASAIQNFTVSGSNLTANIVVTAPTGFEVSTASGSGYGNTVTLTPSSGAVSTTTIYIRLKSSATGTPSGNITIASSGVTTKNIAVSGTVKTVPATPAASSNSPVATGGTIILTAPNVSGATYTWTGPNGFSTTIQNPSITNITAAAAGTYSVTVTVNGCTSAAGTTVVTVNSAPTVSLSSGATAFTEGIAVVIDNALTVTDADNTTLASATVSITGNFQSGQDVLSFTNQNGITGSYNAGTGVLSLSGSSSLANYQAALRSVRYNNTSDNPNTANRTISFTVNDGTANSTAATKTVSVTAVNDGPTVTGLPASLTFIEDATTTGLDLTGIAIADVDIGTGNMTLTFTASSGIFDIAAGTGLTISGHLTNVLSLTGSLTNIHNYLNQPTNIYYRPAANVNGANAATITLTANDNGNTGSGGANNVTLGTININITAINDAPTVTAQASIDVYQNISNAITGISFTDVDAGSASVTVTLSCPSGSLASTSGAGVTVGGTASALTLTGSIANINSFIAASNVAFTPPTNSTANITLTVSINDGGNTGSGGALADSKTVTLVVVDNIAPTVSSVTSSTANGTYKIDDVISIQVNFNEAVTVTGTPQLTLETGATDRVLDYTSGSGTSTLTFNYTVQVGDISADLDYLSTTALALNGGTIKDAGGNSAILTLASPGAAGSLGANNAIVIDGVRPTVSSINRVTDESTNATTVDYTLTFSESVTGVDVNDFTLSSTGIIGGTVAAISGSGSIYTVSVNSITGNGTLRLNLKGSGTGIIDAAGNAITSGYTSGQAYIFDHANPIISSITVPANGTYKIGDNLDFTINFNENITVNTAGGTPGIELTIGGNTRYAQYLSSSGTSALTFRYTVISGDEDNNGIAIDELSLNGGTIKDAVGNNATLTLNNVGSTTAVLVDGVRPTLTITSNVSSLKIGETATITFTFSEDPGSSFSWDGNTGDVIVSVGSLSAISGTGLTHTATFTPPTNTNAGTVSITVAAGSYTDAAGNAGGAGTTPTLSFDTQAPSAPSTPDLAASSDSGTSDADNITNNATPTFTGTAEAGSTVRLYDTDGTTVLGTTTATGGSWSITSNTLSEGSHTITARVADVAGNTSAISSGLAITIDLSAPAVPSALAATFGDRQNQLNWTANSESDLYSYELYHGTATNPTTKLSIAAGTTTHTHSSLTNGTTYYYRITAIDNAGNKSNYSNEVTATPKATPTITFNALANKTYGDADFSPAASSTNTATGITYTSSNTAVATIVSGQIHIVGAGNTTITASQAADGSNTAAVSKEQELTVDPKALTATAQAVSKVYDGNAVATISFDALTGLVGSDQVSVNYTSASYNNKHADNNKSITINGLELVGVQVGNYSLNTFSTTGVITTKAINVTAQADTKVYDGTPGSTVTPVVTALATGDAISTAATQSYADKHTGTGKILTPVGLVINDGNSGLNYVITYVANTNGVITAKPISVTAQADTKVYDGTPGSTVAPAVDALATGDAITTQSTQSYNSKHAGTAKTLTASGLVINDGNSGLNYAITYVANTNGVITAKPINVTAQADTKVYDGTPGSTLVPAVAALATGDNINTAATQSYADKHRGTGKTLTPAGLVINDGNSGLNYAITYVANTNGVITAKPISVTAQADTKVYDGTPGSTVAPAVDALATGDAITTQSTQSYNSKHAGTAKTLTASGLVINDGNSGLNYAITYVANTNGIITAKPINVTAQAVTKVYDGTTSSAVAPVVEALATGDAISTAATQSYNNKNVGTGKTLTPVGLVINDGNSGANYAVNYVNNTSGVITPATLTYVATPATKVYGDANPSVTGTVTGFVTGDNQGNATSGTLSFSTPANNTSGIGSYAINGSGLTAANYTFGQAAGNAGALTVTARPITITADAQAKTYGDNDPALTYQITTGSLVNGDAFTGALVRDGGQDAGSYAIKQGTVLLSNNYNLSYEPADLTINKALLTVTANHSSRCYAAVNPVFSVSYSGFKYSDNENSLTTRPAVGTTANAGSIAGNYELVASGGVSANYDFSYVKGTLTVNPLPINTIASSEGTGISKGQTTVLTVNSDNGTSYSWSSASGIISGENSASLTVRPMETTTYTVTVRNANGCESISTITIEVKEDYMAVQAENFLTPNGDGVNDTWMIKNIDAYPNHTLSIVDRSGREVYKTRSYQNDWDGTFNGMPLAEGTYYYIIRFDQNQPSLKMVKGFITIVRSK